MTIDPSTIDEIRKATFPSALAWRGYDKVEVEKYLETLADWLEAYGGGAGAPAPSGGTDDRDATIADLENRIEELERELKNARRRERAAKSKKQATGESPRATGRSERPAGRRKRAPSRGAGSTPPAGRSQRGPVDLNSVTFEQLRELGLSVRQSASLIALRDSRGGFDSLDVLDEIEGLQPKVLAELKTGLTLRSGREPR